MVRISRKIRLVLDRPHVRDGYLVFNIKIIILFDLNFSESAGQQRRCGQALYDSADKAEQKHEFDGT